ncbi:MAG: hypothetical protein J6O41_08450, partial [Clostridia bacterium]|nr:hypothetical protein [Clostridia bacterium]
MKPWYENKKLFFVFALILCFQNSIQDDCDSTLCTSNGITCSNVAGQTCPPNCKPKYGDTTNCYNCNGIVDYYTIDSNNNCLNQCLGDKIIGDSGQCIYENLPRSNFKKLGDVYYHDSGTTYSTLTNCPSNVCSCNNYYSIETLNGKKIYTCFNTLEDEELKGYKYYNYRTLELYLFGCPLEFNVQKTITLTSPAGSITRCYDKCIGSEFLIEIQNSGITNYYCVDSCGTSPYESYNLQYTDNDVKKCLTQCPDGTFIKNSVCVTLDQCDFYDPGTRICYSTCPDNAPDLRFHNSDSKECISQCPSVDYIYRSTSPTDYTCYKKEDCNFVKESVTPHTCLSSCEGSGEFHDYDSKLCTSSCGSEDTTKIYYAYNGHICYSSCSEIPGEYVYEREISGKRVCYKKANKPSDTDCQAFYQSANGILKCTTISDCITTLHKNYLIGDECRDSCNGYYQIELTISTNKYIKCFATLDAALADGNVKFYDKTQKKCWETFPDVNSYFLKSYTNTDTKFEVVRECPNYYNEFTDSTTVCNGCFQCITNCKTKSKFFVSGNKKCGGSCDLFSKYYYDDSNNECLDSCELRPNKPFSDKLTVASGQDLPSPVICKDSCDTSKYYDYNSHICLSACESPNLYTKRTTDTDTSYKNICYPSCLDIPGGTYKYELSDNSCTNIEITSFPHNDAVTSKTYHFYYEKSYGIIKYAQASDCTNLNFIYIVGNECKRNCEDTYYKMTVTVSSTQFTKCFAQPSGCLGARASTSNKIYYNQNLKKCWEGNTGIPTTYFIKEISNDLYELVDECENYYYEQGVFKYCIEKCMSNQDTSKTYFINGNKKCLDQNECLTLQKYLYDPSNKECLDTCKERPTYNFQPLIQNTPTSLSSCQQSCSTAPYLYYSYNSNICMEKCGDDGSNNKYHANGGYICYPYCLNIPNGNYVYEIQENDDTFTCNDDKSAAVSAGCNYFIQQSNGIKKCTTAADCYNNNKIYILDNECKDNCENDYYKLDFKIDIDTTTAQNLKPFIKCFQTIDDCFSDANVGVAAGVQNPIYYNEKLKKCWKVFPNDYYIKNKDNSNKYELIEKCDDFYYVHTTTGENICTSNCKTLTDSLYFIKGNQQCLTKSQCFTNNQKYYDPENNECLNTCKGRPLYKFQHKIPASPPQTEVEACVENCNSGTNADVYYSYDSSECLNYCGEDGSINKYYPDNAKDCYPSCLDIPGGNHIYEIKDTTTYTTALPTNHIIYKCYNTIPGNCDYYYISSDGTRKCTTITDCYNKGYTYIVGQECKNKCESDYYKLDYEFVITVGESTAQKPFVICLQTIDDCKLYGTASTASAPLYFHEKSKKCWKTFPRDYYIKDKGTTSLEKYELVEKCDEYYYVDTTTGENICTSNCKTSNSLYFIKGNQKCMALTDCKTFSKYYYVPSTNECLDTCIGRDNLEFADYIDFEASSPAPAPTECKSTCGSSQHYNFGTKICLDTTTCTTGKFIRRNAPNPKVCYSSCAEIPSGDILYEKGSECYLKTEFSDFEANCPYYFKRDDNTIKCAATIPECQSAGYDYLDDTECKKDCGDFYKYLDTSSNNIIRCYQNYEIAHSKINAIEYYDKTYKELWSSYPPTMFILYDNNGASFEVVRVCDTYYYEKDTVNHINYCKDDCKSVNLFFLKDNKKCESSCNSFSKKYYNPTNNECLDTCSVLNDLKYSNPVNTDASSDSIPEACLQICPNYFITKLDGSNTIYECVENCPPDSASPYKLIDIKTKECLQSCKSDQNQDDVDNQYCYPKCDVDNGFVYINTDNYSCVKTCPSYLQKWELLGNFGGRDVFLCKSSCNENEYRLEDKCLTQCPQNFNFIGYDKICKAESCALDPNGQRYYPINEYDVPPPSYLIYKCINSCSTATINSKNYFFYTEDDPYKCLETCPSTHRFYLYSNQNECIKKCPENYPFYNDPSGIATPVLCKDRTDCNANQFFDSGNCISECPTGKKYVSSDRRCLDKCPDNEIKKKSSTFDTDQTYNCLRSCEKFIYKKNVEDEPECVDYCPDGNYVGKDNDCKISCDEEDGLFYYEIDFTGVTPSPPSSDYKLYKCIDGCKGDYKYREVDNGNQCYKTCTANFPYLSSDERLCYDICLKSKDKPFTLDKQDSTGASLGKICSNECTNDGTNVNIYYGDNKVCIKDCAELEDAKITDHDNHCVANCDKSSSYLFQLNNKCVDKCEDDNPSAAVDDPLPKKRYSLGDYVCKEKCIENENIVINGRQCVSSCNNYISPLTTGEYECIPSCSNTDYPFFYPSDKKCLPHCKTGDKVVQDLNTCVSNCGENYFLYKTSGESDVFKPYDMCVLRCPDNKPYIYNGECVEICPETTKKFFQSEFTHGETERHQICLTDCPVNYPYYTVRVVPGPPAKNYYECKSTCEGYYVPNEDSLIQAKLCVSTCTATDTYKFRIEKIIDNKLIKKCYPTCPTEAKYHFDTDTTPSINDDNKCYEECPEINPYHEKGSTKCKKLSQLSAGFILYDIKEWVSATGLSNCPSDYKLYSQTESPYNVIKICLKEECEFKDEAGSLYIYKTPYNTCVKDCSNSASSPLVNGKNLINDVINKKCVCENLYYIHETSHEITCYAGSIGKVCKEMATATTPYPLPLNGTNQCLKSCDEDRILNPSENICYEKNTPCSEINSYTKLITTNGHKKCDCSYKYYFESTHVNKTCLAENAICTGHNNLYIPATMECVSACPSTYSFKFRNFCLDHCPLGSTIGTNECNCGDKFWYESYPGNYECLEGECLDEFTLYAPQNKQCLKTCIGGYYPILYENKCYDKCDSAT